MYEKWFGGSGRGRFSGSDPRKQPAVPEKQGRARRGRRTAVCLTAVLALALGCRTGIFPTAPQNPAPAVGQTLPAEAQPENSGEALFFDRFPELDADTVRAYVDRHPEAVADGWEHLWVRETGPDAPDTGIRTGQGDRVLAIDGANGLLAVRITGSTYRGVLVLGRDPARLRCAAAGDPAGTPLGELAAAENALVAITGSGFSRVGADEAQMQVAGSAMSGGVPYGTHFPPGYKRLELRTDHRLYLVDAHTAFSPTCTDATEWTPALIVDGTDVSGQDRIYTAWNPRACLGQTRDGTVLFLGIEGRRADSLGCSARECAAILMRYGGYQAMNLDGGSSAALWYQGEPLLRSGSGAEADPRLPNAWIYGAEAVPDP